MKPTAVEWLVEDLGAYLPISITSVKLSIEQAKEIEKQQIMDAYIECKKEYIVKMDCYPPQFVVDEAEQYYNEQFKNK